MGNSVVAAWLVLGRGFEFFSTMGRHVRAAGFL